MTLTALRLTLLPPRAAEAGGLIAVDPMGLNVFGKIHTCGTTDWHGLVVRRHIANDWSHCPLKSATPDTSASAPSHNKNFMFSTWRIHSAESNGQANRSTARRKLSSTPALLVADGLPAHSPCSRAWSKILSMSRFLLCGKVAALQFTVVWLPDVLHVLDGSRT